MSKDDTAAKIVVDEGDESARVNIVVQDLQYCPFRLRIFLFGDVVAGCLLQRRHFWYFLFRFDSLAGNQKADAGIQQLVVAVIYAFANNRVEQIEAKSMRLETETVAIHDAENELVQVVITGCAVSYHKLL